MKTDNLTPLTMAAYTEQNEPETNWFCKPA